MFKKLRNKLKSWTENLSKESETEEAEESEAEEAESSEEKKTSKESKKDKKSKKGKDKKSDKKSKKKDKKSKEEKKKEKKEKKEKDYEKEISPPMKFDAGKQKYEPDLEKVEEEAKKKEEGEEKYEEPEKSETEHEDEKPEQGDEKEEPEKEKKKKSKGFLGFGGGKGKRKVKITEKIFEEYSEDLEMILLENNVALEVSEKIIDALKEEVVGQEFSKKEIEEKIYQTLKETIMDVLVDPYDVVEKIRNRENKDKPYVILFCGVNGTGKTTSIAKISKLLEKNKISSVLAAGDTFRAASIEQLKKHGDNLGVEVIAGSYGSDPASVGFDAIKYAEKNDIDVVLIDTAGRMYTNKNLMQEIEKVSRVCKPDLKLFVGESTTGNDALEQVKAFNDSVGVDGIVLAKADIDEKGGTALSVGYVTGKPILYLGTGQEYKDIEPFDKEKFVEKLFNE